MAADARMPREQPATLEAPGGESLGESLAGKDEDLTGKSQDRISRIPR